MKKILLLIAFVALSSCESEGDKCNCIGEFIKDDGSRYWQKVTVWCNSELPVNYKRDLFVKCNDNLDY